ncbi:hypothetical protein Tco_0583928 [Tanacetum coccineum]
MGAVALPDHGHGADNRDFMDSRCTTHDRLSFRLGLSGPRFIFFAPDSAASTQAVIVFHPGSDVTCAASLVLVSRRAHVLTPRSSTYQLYRGHRTSNGRPPRTPSGTVHRLPPRVSYSMTTLGQKSSSYWLVMSHSVSVASTPSNASPPPSPCALHCACFIAITHRTSKLSPLCHSARHRSQFVFRITSSAYPTQVYFYTHSKQPRYTASTLAITRRLNVVMTPRPTVQPSTAIDISFTLLRYGQLPDNSKTHAAPYLNRATSGSSRLHSLPVWAAPDPATVGCK